jgi:Family of unknown function (DUF6533)
MCQNIAMCTSIPCLWKTRSVHSFLSLTDAVVIWDWVTSLPREWRFVNSKVLTSGAFSDRRRSQIWKTHWTPVKMAYLFCRYVIFCLNCITAMLKPNARYWVIAVVPYLLYSFVMDHSLETCQKIFRVSITIILRDSFGLSIFLQIPVALAMWNQVGSECQFCSPSWLIPALISSIYSAVLLIRTYAFFNRNVYVLLFLISAIGGVVSYQLYVDSSQMLRSYWLLFQRFPRSLWSLVLPFVNPPFVSTVAIEKTPYSPNRIGVGPRTLFSYVETAFCAPTRYVYLCSIVNQKAYNFLYTGFFVRSVTEAAHPC